MKSFIELFQDARAVSTPIIAVRTFDPASTIRNVRKSLGNAVENVPLISYDSIHGLKGLNEDHEGKAGAGTLALTAMLQLAGMQQEELGSSVDLSIALGILEYASEDVIAFVHNPQLAWPTDPKVVQAIWNLRDGFKANGNMVVLLTGVGDILPTELQQDILVLEEPLPTREELAKIVTETFAFAAQNDNYKKCTGAATPAVVKDACDALIGLPAFPAEQATAMCLEKVSGVLDIEQLWDRKRTIVSQRPGLTFCQPQEKLVDMYGNLGFGKFATGLMEGKYAPTVILRVDEIEKQFAGNGTDSSGSTGKQLGEFLSWIEDKKIICTLELGVPGSSKSWAPWCIAGQYKKPLIKFDLAAMEDKLVGEGGKILRGAERTVEAISDGRIWLIATANSLRGLPPELISRFQVGGIFFFDAPNSEEQQGIMKLKIAKYKLEANQPIPDMSGWTGRDIENCARKAQLLSVSLVEAGKFIVPLMKSHHEEMDALRKSAHGRFLSASHTGVYEYTTPSDKTVVLTPTVVNGRKLR